MSDVTETFVYLTARLPLTKPLQITIWISKVNFVKYSGILLINRSDLAHGTCAVK